MTRQLLTMLAASLLLVSLAVADTVMANDFDPDAYLADRGDAQAQYNLGLKYATGQGIPQNYFEAVRWYRPAADHGRADAQNNLALMYNEGKGVRQDFLEAVKWYRRAAEQGYATAQYNLGLVHTNGTGVPQDNVLAYMWFSLSAAQGDKDAIVSRNGLAQRMTSAQIAKAAKLARDWRATTVAQAGAAQPVDHGALPAWDDLPATKSAPRQEGQDFDSIPPDANAKAILDWSARSANCETDSIESVSGDGGIIKMLSGAIFQVDGVDQVDTQLWLPADDVVVCDDARVINTDESSEQASVAKLR
ncbi:tetratricopeptide repeat protein [Bradyrhizobium genosp. P]|uniref:tetratricopeptide repeat protein n=1 Tax=Bradyrhizobium genosp. P TaxID=83641 RepID=UPI003CF15A79